MQAILPRSTKVEINDCERKDPAGTAAFYVNIPVSIMRDFHARQENAHSLYVKRYSPRVTVPAREDTYGN